MRGFASAISYFFFTASGCRRPREFPTNATRGGGLPGFTLAFQQRKNVFFSYGSLDVSNDRSRGVIHELDAHLGDTTSRPSSSKDLDKGGKPIDKKVQHESLGDCKDLDHFGKLDGCF